MGFFHWRRNEIDFTTAKPLFFSFFIISLIAMLFMWIYKERINKYFTSENKKFLFKTLNLDQLFIVIGIVAIFFNIVRLIILLVLDFPWKSELIPLQLCRFFTYFIPLLFIFKRARNINLFSIIAILGAIIGYAFANLGPNEQFIKDDIMYHNLQPGSIEYQKAGYNVGYDNFIYWDFIFAHSFILIITVLTHIIYGEQAKITHSVFIKGGIYIILMAILVFFGNWILNTIANNASNVRIKIALDANWFYLGQVGINVLGSLSKWPISLPIFVIFGTFAYIIGYIIYILLSCISISINNYYLPNKIIFSSFKKKFWELKASLKDVWKVWSLG
ncbi:YwaF family protein [Mycoplasmopsis cynos]|uniref:TMEM164 family acyltransferase n=2 Tax=Mycoplasmopsis cynos TaxID=171284 RepID=UPI002AFFBEC0|nr:hypothetical protein [Mycoplasmopsis cynos]WQQ14360.1 YwaF family protein [Mycoplasmopsis cynos]WQQ16402.1 YwaF family protein [Mycoplasmopsis cynos]WQQ19301.1 YwaF family protein [Mycoplasmopsis cynos]